MIRRARFLLLGCFAAFAAGGSTVDLRAGDAVRAEMSLDELNAYFVLNCAYFGTWPDAVDPQKTKLLRIAVLGANPFGDSFDHASRRARLSWFSPGTIELVKIRSVEEAVDFHILWVSGGEDRVAKRAVEFLADRPVLVVSDANDFIQQGGMIRVGLVDSSFAFDVNLDRLKRSGLTLSSKFISRASRVLRDGALELNERRRVGP